MDAADGIDVADTAETGAAAQVLLQLRLDAVATIAQVPIRLLHVAAEARTRR